MKMYRLFQTANDTHAFPYCICRHTFHRHFFLWTSVESNLCKNVTSVIIACIEFGLPPDSPYLFQRIEKKNNVLKPRTTFYFCSHRTHLCAVVLVLLSISMNWLRLCLSGKVLNLHRHRRRRRRRGCNKCALDWLMPIRHHTLTACSLCVIRWHI